ncbi:hypothetical protein L6164_033614 [Bauhinia variegata]|uniref:Uncharacterized protein n=1 Tax=Bauhinia variegata TaxID=167791 RepID=A0ACB9KSX5_BAUVA|nr:hypothetical protein L6164_033614 [Bauhinia variegata]
MKSFVHNRITSPSPQATYVASHYELCLNIYVLFQVLNQPSLRISCFKGYTCSPLELSHSPHHTRLCNPIQPEHYLLVQQINLASSRSRNEFIKHISLLEYVGETHSFQMTIKLSRLPSVNN